MERRCEVPHFAVGFVLLLLWVLALVIFGQVEQGVYEDFTMFLRANTHSESIRGYVDVQRKGRVDFWVVKDGDFTNHDYMYSILWVANLVRRDKEIGNYAEGLYFRREKDRFSFAEIGARECVYVAELLENCKSEEEIERLVRKAVRFTTKKR